MAGHKSLSNRCSAERHGLSVTPTFGPPFLYSLASPGKRFYVHAGFTFIYTEKGTGDFGNNVSSFGGERL
jgi:hypothetical protein